MGDVNRHFMYLLYRKLQQFIQTVDIAHNPEPAAIFDGTGQGFNLWAIPSDHPGGDWEVVLEHFDAGAFTKRCAFVGTAWLNGGTGQIEITSDAYKLRDHIKGEYLLKGAIHNRPDDLAWIRAKVEWVFEQMGEPCPEIVEKDE